MGRKDTMDKYTMAVVDFLRNHPGVSDLHLDRREPAPTSAIHAWETANAPLKLPEDLKSFLLLSDGFSLQWDVCFGGCTHALGNMALNGIQGLGNRLVLDASPADDKSDGLVIVPPGGAAVEGAGIVPKVGDASVEGGGGEGARRGSGAAAARGLGFAGVDGAGAGDGDRTRGWSPPVPTAAFDLDASCGCGRVALVFVDAGASSPLAQSPAATSASQAQRPTHVHVQVWFQDLATRWHVLAGSFSEYFRVMVAHLGLPNWQYAFTDVGLDPAARQWFAFLGPERLAVDLERGRLKRAKKARRNRGGDAARGSAGATRARSVTGSGGGNGGGRPATAAAAKLSSPAQPATAAPRGKLASGAWPSARGGGSSSGRPPVPAPGSTTAAKARSLYAASFGPMRRGGAGATGSATARPASAPASRKPMR